MRPIDTTDSVSRGMARRALAFVLAGFAAVAAGAEVTWTQDQRGVLAAIERLSATTAPGGAGAEAYGDVLDDGYSRWTMGSKGVDDKRTWVEGVREWFDEGWRVTERETRHLEILVRGDLAHVRRVVAETYLGPDGEHSGSAAALGELWVRSADDWKLLRVDAQTLDAD